METTTASTNNTQSIVELVPGAFNEFEIHTSNCKKLKKHQKLSAGGRVYEITKPVAEHIAQQVDLYERQQQFWDAGSWHICQCVPAESETAEEQADEVIEATMAELAQHELDRREFNRKNKKAALRSGETKWGRLEAANPWLFKASKLELLELLG